MMNDNNTPSLTPMKNQTMIHDDINDNNNNINPLALLSHAAAEAACDAMENCIIDGAQPRRRRRSHSSSSHSSTTMALFPPSNNNNNDNKKMNNMSGSAATESAIPIPIPAAAAAVHSDDDDVSSSRLSLRSLPSSSPLFLIPPHLSSMVNSNNNNNAAFSSSSTVLGVFPQFSYPSSSSSSLPQQDHLSISPEMEITLTHPQPITPATAAATTQRGGRVAINNNKRDGKYRMKYAYYSMSRKDAHRYIQELTYTSNMQEQKRRILRLRENNNMNLNKYAPVGTTASDFPLLDKNPPPIPVLSSHQSTPTINPATSYLISTTNGGGASGPLW
jgi:hypothetical protein